MAFVAEDLSKRFSGASFFCLIFILFYEVERKISPNSKSEDEVVASEFIYSVYKINFINKILQS